MDEVALFPTCLGEELFPEARDAVREVLERLRLRVRLVRRSFCCGQPAFNEGFRAPARDLARRFVNAFEPGRPIVVPSGSCTSMIKVFYPELFAKEPQTLERFNAIRPWVFEFSQFLVDVLKVKYVGARFERTVAYHPSCHLLRELKIRDQPRTLLSAVNGIRLVELGDRDECCGFGGLFSVKFPHISGAMLEDKLARIRASGASTVVANDCGCLMQIKGGLHRAGDAIQARHIAEVLAAR